MSVVLSANIKHVVKKQKKKITKSNCLLLNISCLEYTFGYVVFNVL